MDAFMQAQLAREAAASTRLDGETHSLPSEEQVDAYKEWLAKEGREPTWQAWETFLRSQEK